MKIIHRFNNPLKVALDLYKGLTLIRASFNQAVSRYELHGDVLDLGSKSMKSTYYRYIKRSDGTKVTFTDLKEGEGVVRLNVEEQFPFEDQSFDCVVSFHLFEHVFNFSSYPSEVFRVLKPGGKLIVSVPFMHKYHQDPEDYFRFTDTAIVRIWEEAGLCCESMEYIGDGVFSFSATTSLILVKPKALRGILRSSIYLLLSHPLDRVVNFLQRNRGGKTTAQEYALEHLAVFRK